MIFEHKFRTGVKDFSKKGLISNKTILEILENVACYHADSIQYGPLDIGKTNVSWVLLEWEVKVIKRPKYGEIITAKTWARDFARAHTYRDFELYDSEGNLAVIGTSKWVLVNATTKKLTMMVNEVIDRYGAEKEQVFGRETVEKIDVPENFTNEISYQVARRDIDFNGHMHNIYYLDLAEEALPDDVYENRPYNNIRITYKKGIKLGEKIVCKYAKFKEKHIVQITDESDKIVHAQIAMW